MSVYRWNAAPLMATSAAEAMVTTGLTANYLVGMQQTQDLVELATYQHNALICGALAVAGVIGTAIGYVNYNYEKRSATWQPLNRLPH